MTKSQIKAELRRSAMEDRYPAWNENTPCDVGPGSWYGDFVVGEGFLSDLGNENCRIFFLLVAEAL